MEAVQKLDLEHLRFFVALMQEGGVTRTARRMNISQAAASARLARLRDHLGDPLMVPEGRLLAPTPRALALLPGLSAALRNLDAVLATQLVFDPQQEERIFRLGATSLAAHLLLPHLLGRFRSLAPRCRLMVREGDHPALAEMLALDDVAAIIGHLGQELPAQMRLRRFDAMPCVALRDAGSPAITDIATLCERPHAVLATRCQLQAAIDQALADQGLQRQVVVETESYGLLPALLRDSEIVAIVPEAFARQAHGLQADPISLDLHAAQPALAWSPRYNEDPATRWFLALVADCYKEANL